MSAQYLVFAAVFSLAACTPFATSSTPRDAQRDQGAPESRADDAGPDTSTDGAIDGALDGSIDALADATSEPTFADVSESSVDVPPLVDAAPDAPDTATDAQPIDVAPRDVVSDAPVIVYRDCADVRARLLAAGSALTDDVYAIDPDDAGPLPTLSLYCADLATTAPLEYLPVDLEQNYSRNTQYSCPCVYWDYRFSRVRLRIDRRASVRLLAVLNDTRFTSFRYLDARGEPRARCTLETDRCEARMADRPGYWSMITACLYASDGIANGRYSLAGTGLRFPAGTATRYGLIGESFNPSNMRATLSSDRLTLELTLAGACAVWGPNDFVTSATLELEPR